MPEGKNSKRRLNVSFPLEGRATLEEERLWQYLKAIRGASRFAREAMLLVLEFSPRHLPPSEWREALSQTRTLLLGGSVPEESAEPPPTTPASDSSAQLGTAPPLPSRGIPESKQPAPAAAAPAGGPAVAATPPSQGGRETPEVAAVPPPEAPLQAAAVGVTQLDRAGPARSALAPAHEETADQPGAGQDPPGQVAPPASAHAAGPVRDAAASNDQADAASEPAAPQRDDQPEQALAAEAVAHTDHARIQGSVDDDPQETLKHLFAGNYPADNTEEGAGSSSQT